MTGLKKEREKKNPRHLEEGNVERKKNQREKTMMAAIDGSASLIHIDVSACECVRFAFVLVVYLYTRGYGGCV